ncbi:hypothetical protein [Rhodoligotrophos defluvii]|uniref:hypothetical protein n=1 Tax=Rhodoligotrophos defluvii TaxID=2561934 RepID=UPI0010C96EEC|nr:hypothetical protein [Rhodoligotrophos defluvii]
MTIATVYSAADVALRTGETLDFAYPAGTTADSFVQEGSKAFARGTQVLLSQDAGDYSLAFQESKIVFTYNKSTPLPPNTMVALQLTYASGLDGGGGGSATPLTFDTVAQMKQRTEGWEGIAQLFGYNGVNDGGGGPIYWDAESEEEADDGLVFMLNNWTGPGRAKRLL